MTPVSTARISGDEIILIFPVPFTWTCLPPGQVQVFGRTQSPHGPAPVLSRLLGRTTPVSYVLLGFFKIPGCEAAAVGAAAGGRPVARTAGVPVNTLGLLDIHGCRFKSNP